MTVFLHKHRAIIGAAILLAVGAAIVNSMMVDAQNNVVRRQLAMDIQRLDISPVRYASPAAPAAHKRCAAFVDRTLNINCPPPAESGAAQ
ncbi:MAG: hypothetical protein AAGF49_08935 [Pseudomonadota bacterium]